MYKPNEIEKDIELIKKVDMLGEEYEGQYHEERERLHSYDPKKYPKPKPKPFSIT